MKKQKDKERERNEKKIIKEGYKKKRKSSSQEIKKISTRK